MRDKPNPSEPPRAWLMVWASFLCLTVIFGVSYSFAAFFEDFSQAFSAQRADVSLVFGLCGLVYFVLGALGGILADRWGPRIVCMTGMAMIALGLYLTSLAQTLGSIYLSFGLLVGLGIAFVYTPAIAAVQPWFTDRRVLASGIAGSGVGAGTLMVPVAVSYLLVHISWRDTLQAMALAVLLLGCGAAYLLERAPSPGTGASGQASGLTLAQTLKTPVFRWLYLGALLSAPVMFIPFAHISAAARDAGLPDAQAVGLVGLIGIGSLTGRFGIAWVANRWGRIQTLLLMQCLLGLSYFVWAGAQETWMFSAFALCFGLSYGSIVSLMPAICMDLFGGKAVSAIIGTLYTGAALGNLLGPVLAGKIFDLTHSYTLVIYLALGLSAIAAASCWRTLQYADQKY